MKLLSIPFKEEFQFFGKIDKNHEFVSHKLDKIISRRDKVFTKVFHFS